MADVVRELLAVDALIEFLRAANFEKQFVAMDATIAAGVKENFVREIDGSGKPWPARKDDLPHPLLRKTLAMHKAATEPNDPGHVLDIQGLTALAGVDVSVVRYAGYQNNGTSIIPAREYLYPTESVADEAAEVFADSLVAQVFPDGIGQ